MKEKKEFAGFWFLSENPQKIVPGTVKFDPDTSLNLELIGNFFEEKISFFDHGKNYSELIHGVDSEGKKISLVKCRVFNHVKTYKSKFSLTKYKIGYLLEGIHLSSENDKTFFQANFHTDKLNGWFARTNIKNSYTFNSDNEISGFNLSYDKSKDGFSFQSIFQGDFSLEILSNSWQHEKDFDGIDIKEIYTVKIKQNSQISFVDFIESIEKLILFFEFAFTSRVKIQSLYLFPYKSHLKKETDKSIGLYYLQSRNLRPKSPYERPIFNFNLISESFDKILNNWMSIDKRLEPILNYLIKSFQNDHNFDPSNFMTIINTLEGFHRRFRESKKIELKSRLNSIIDEFKTIDIITRLDLDTFKISKNRHYYSHFYEEDYEYLYEIGDLFGITVNLRILLICCILRHIGFDDNLLNNVNLDTL
ncbi:HEPN domain-containing protein [Rhodonellum sp.]|uniref:ApeA N-terminal domain 1-containing protein n=1 Tax=Rhodonellum sp. TaxID=2231180 RepID=UPI002727F14F|nr:HEPN domain-containing protein [Rhodonellum sp.]MDO9552492.1 hypothetical protein [Rhodonellum sp.]